MPYTNEQYEMMERLSPGLVWIWHRPWHENEDEILRYLISDGVCQAREDIQENLLVLTQYGKAVLAARDTARNVRDHQAEEITRHNTAPTEKMAKDGKENATENSKWQPGPGFTIFITVLSAFLIFFLDKYVERTIGFIINLLRSLHN